MRILICMEGVLTGKLSESWMRELNFISAETAEFRSVIHEKNLPVCSFINKDPLK